MKALAGISVGEKVREALEEKNRRIRSKAEIVEEEKRGTVWAVDKCEFKNQILIKLGLLPSEISAERLDEMGLVCQIGYWFSSVEYGTEPAFFDKVVYRLKQELVVYHFEAFTPYAIVIIPRNEKQWDDILGLDGADALHRCFRRGAYQNVAELLS